METGLGLYMTGEGADHGGEPVGPKNEGKSVDFSEAENCKACRRQLFAFLRP